MKKIPHEKDFLPNILCGNKDGDSNGDMEIVFFNR